MLLDHYPFPYSDVLSFGFSERWAHRLWTGNTLISLNSKPMHKYTYKNTTIKYYFKMLKNKYTINRQVHYPSKNQRFLKRLHTIIKLILQRFLLNITFVTICIYEYLSLSQWSQLTVSTQLPHSYCQRWSPWASILFVKLRTILCNRMCSGCPRVHVG